MDLVHHPSEAEQVLRLLPAQLRALRSLPPAAGTPPGLPGCVHAYRGMPSLSCVLTMQMPCQVC